MQIINRKEKTMPRVRELTTNRRIIDVRKQLTSKCMFDDNIKLEQVASLLDVTPQALSHQLRNGVKLETVLAVLYLTGADGEITRTMNKVRL